MSTTAPQPEAIDSEVVVYVTRWCPYCIMALRLLDDREIDHEIVNVEGDREARAWLRERTSQTTVPQIFIKGRSVGGFVELTALDRSGELRELLLA